MTTPTVMSQLENFLSLNNKRETVVAANMANIDTPGYHTQDLRFDQVLANTANGFDAPLSGIGTRNVRGLLERPDGNNVDLDRESTLLAESQLNYQIGTQLLKSRFHQLLSAINGGGGAE